MISSIRATFRNLAIVLLVAALSGEIGSAQEVRVLPSDRMAGNKSTCSKSHVRLEFGNSSAFLPQGLRVRRDVKGVLRSPQEIFLGEPLVLRFDVECHESAGCSIPSIDLAGASPRTTVLVLFSGSDGRQYAIERRAIGSEVSIPSALRPPSVKLKPGELVSLWIDLVGLIDSRYCTTRMYEDGIVETNREEILRKLVRLGTWKVVFFLEDVAANIEPTEIQVLPYPREADAQDNYSHQSPAPEAVQVLVSESKSNAHVHAVGPFSNHREQLYGMIAVLASAVSSCETGLTDVWSAPASSYGAFQDLVREVEFECLLETGRLEEATQVAKRLPIGNVAKIESGNGQVSRLRE